MWHPARKFLLLALLLCFAPLKAQAQSGFIQVSGTITDPQGFPYAGGSTTGATISAILVPSGGTSPTLHGKTFTTSVGPIALNNDGSFTIALADNTVVVPSGTQWQFTVVGTSGLPWPIGRGSQAFQVTLQIHGNGLVQDISSQLSAAAPSLTNVCANSNLPAAATCGTGGIGGSTTPNFVPFTTAPDTLADTAWEYGTISSQGLICNGGLSSVPCQIEIAGGTVIQEASILTAINLCFNEGGISPTPICATGNLDGSLGLGPDGKIDLSGNLTVVSCKGCVNPLGSAGALPEFAAYDFYPNSGTFYARNNSTGAIDFSGSDAGAVIRSAIAAVPCSMYNLKLGTYTVNSLVNDTTGGYNVWPAIDIPATAGSAGQYCKYTFVGEAIKVYSGAVQTNGVILDVTNTAIATAGGGTPPVGGFFHQADTVGLVGNEVEIRNIEVRLPANNRGNTFHFLLWEADTITMIGDVATWANNFNSTLPVAGSFGNFCFGGQRGSHDYAYFRRNTAFGCDVGFDIPGEHSNGENNDSYHNNYAMKVGFGEPAAYAGASQAFVGDLGWTGFTDNHNLNGVAFGPNVVRGSTANFPGVQVEIEAVGGTYARVADWTETNPGFVGGIITYTYSIGASSFGNQFSVFSPNLWTSGGGHELTLNSLASQQVALAPASDNFTRANNNVLGSEWVTDGIAGQICQATGNGMGIQTNAAFTSTSGGVGCFYIAIVSPNDQFSKATVGSIDANGERVAVRGTASTSTDYRFTCTNASSSIIKQISGSNTTIASGGPACATNDTIELWAIGTREIAFKNGVVVLTATDSSIASGSPGIGLQGTGDTFTNWTGGPLPQLDATRSVSGNAFFAPTYNTLTNCSSSASPSVCGSAAAGSVVVAASATTVVVDTTAVTANSQILLMFDSSLGTKLGVTCNATEPALYGVSARSAGTSFTITSTAPTTNPACFSYWIVN